MMFFFPTSYSLTVDLFLYSTFVVTRVTNPQQVLPNISQLRKAVLPTSDDHASPPSRCNGAKTVINAEPNSSPNPNLNSNLNPNQP